MSNYEDRTDKEVNILIGSILGLTVNKQKQDAYEIMSGQFGCADASVFFSDDCFHDYCNNPLDAWPIILQTCMTIELPDPNLGGIGTNTIYNPMGTDWQCDFDNNDDALWAAMVCFLKMKDEQDDI